MSTESFYKNFKIDTKEALNNFIKAIDAADKEKVKSKKPLVDSEIDFEYKREIVVNGRVFSIHFNKIILSDGVLSLQEVVDGRTVIYIDFNSLPEWETSLIFQILVKGESDVLGLN